ncbi:DUF4397 domain-containing protein [Alkalihalophilus marmarensis]|uniref:DUF4397 domain-containing protein n=1 Tax=Alkalihalophilus marmarensis TaxID=521377 RepID=UPI002DBFB1AD|nr:DUF4397 domain-containing protein [Alkalihalophilus marmarensis]MEC2073779.1 DUF4397 domain-containing protein [Alkalihalophilus marmarensis]
MLKKGFILSLVGALTLSFGGAGLAADHGDDEAKVRVVHASPDAPAVDVVLNGDVVVEGADFKAATDYLHVPSGDHEVEIFAAGTVEEEEPVLSATLSVEGGEAYTVAAVNTVENLELSIINDEQMTTSGQTKVRVGHFSPDAPNVDVAVAGGDVLFEDAPFKAVTDYLETAPATLDLEIRVAGTEDVVLELPANELQSDMLYSVFAVGFADGEPGLDVIVLSDMSHEAMPAEMPATGMGGAQNNTSFMPILFAGALALGAAVFFLNIRRKQEA